MTDSPAMSAPPPPTCLGSERERLARSLAMVAAGSEWSKAQVQEPRVVSEGLSIEDGHSKASVVIF